MPISTMSIGGQAAPGQFGAAGQLDPEIAAARKRIQGATYGQATALQNDPYNRAALDFMKGSVAGQNVPFTNTVKNSMMAQHGAGSAAAEQAQMETLRQSLGASGGSIYDPGYQAAQRQAMSERQGSNLDAAGQLEAKAGVENYRAQSQAASQMAAARNAQNAQVNQMKLAGADQDSRLRAAVPQQAPTTPGPVPFSPWKNSQSISTQNHNLFNTFG